MHRPQTRRRPFKNLKEKMNQENTTDIRFPKIQPGYVLGAVTIASYLVLMLTTAGRPQTGGSYTIVSGSASAVMIVSFIAGLVYWLMSVYRLHKTLNNLTSGTYPITARQAVGYQFIPFFNIYWTFKWPAEIADFVNHLESRTAMNRYKYGVILFAASIFSRLLTGISIVVDFAVLSRLIQKTKTAVAERAIPIEYEKPKYNGRAAMICLWAFVAVVVIGLLAAIAIPNFVKARNTAAAGSTASTTVI